MVPPRLPQGLLQWAALFILTAAFHWGARFQPYWWDSLGYVFAHAVEIHDAHLMPVLRHWDVGHPTGYFFLLAVVMKIFGVGPLAGHLLSWAFAALLAWSCHALFRTLGVTRLAAWSLTGALMTFPLVWASTRMITADLALTALLAAALWSWSERRRRLYLAFGSLAVLTKFTGFLILPALAVAALLLPAPEPGTRRREVAWTLGPLAALVAFLVLRWAVRGPGWTIGWEPMQHLVPIWQWTAFRENWPDATRQLWQLTRITWPFMGAMGILALGVVDCRRRGKNILAPGTERPILAVVLFGLAYGAANLQLTALLPRFGLPLALVAFLLLGWAISRQRHPDRWGLVVGGLLMMLNVIQWHPTWSDRLPGPLAHLVRPSPTTRPHNQEIDLRYEDAIALVRWAAVEIQRDAVLRGENGLPGIATQWPLTSALADPRLGYVDHPFPTTGLGGWDEALPTSHPYVLTITGVTNLAPTPPDSLRFLREVGTKTAGTFSAHIWR